MTLTIQFLGRTSHISSTQYWSGEDGPQQLLEHFHIKALLLEELFWSWESNLLYVEMKAEDVFRASSIGQPVAD